ncbi:MAG: CBS domain-containing protein [Mycobacteriales bacterium]
MSSPLANAPAPDAAPTVAVMHLLPLLRLPLLSRTGETVGRLDDVIVRLREDGYPLVTGLVVKVGGRRVFVPLKRIATFSEAQVSLSKEKVDLRGFERRAGEVLLREDILGHRLIDVSDVELVRAYDIELDLTADGWVLARLDTRQPARLMGLIKGRQGHASRDWKVFEPLLGHSSSAADRTAKTRLRRLKPAQIADLLEDANRHEGSEILESVHADPELEADVFEELDPDVATKFFGDMSDEEVAEVLGRMRADDAADAIAELRQQRRLHVLDLLPDGHRTKILTLLGFSPSSAGGLMSTDVMTCHQRMSARDVLQAVAAAHTLQEEALNTVHAVDDDGLLVGTITVIGLLRADPTLALADVVDSDPVRITAQTDAVDIALLMADYNLITVPVVDESNRVLGVVTVDDVLEATIPDDWRRREPAPRPPMRPGDEHVSAQASGPPGDVSAADADV